MEKIEILSTERALTLCANSLRGDVNIIRDQLNQNIAQAFLIDECCFITRVELNAQERELVVMCAEGKGLLNAGQKLKRIAKQNQCTSARMHTNRKGLQRHAKQFGWVEYEKIYKMSI